MEERDINFGSGSPFKDGDLKRPVLLEVKTLLIAEVRKKIKEEGWSMLEAAEEFETEDEKIEFLCGGAIDKLSLADLEQMVEAVEGTITELSIDWGSSS